MSFVVLLVSIDSALARSFATKPRNQRKRILMSEFACSPPIFFVLPFYLSIKCRRIFDAPSLVYAHSASGYIQFYRILIIKYECPHSLYLCACSRLLCHFMLISSAPAMVRQLFRILPIATDFR